MKFEVVRERVSSLPKSTEILTEKDFAKIGEIVKDSIRSNIGTQQQVDGSQLKQNAKSTQDRKLRKGRMVLSLVDELHRFVKNTSWKATVDKNSVTIEPGNNELKDLTRWVQEKKYLGWFGLNRKGVSLTRGVVRRAVERYFKKIP